MQIEIYNILSTGIQERVPSMKGKGVAVIMPSTNMAQAIDAARRMAVLASYPFRMIVALDSVRGGFVKTLNIVASKIEAEFVVYVAQDSLAGQNWLRIAMRNLTETNKSLFAFNDGIFNGTLAQFGVVRMSFCKQFYKEGHIFYEGYHTHRADDELTLISKLSDQFSYSPSALMMEVDYRMERPINDEDAKLYNIRKKDIEQNWRRDKPDLFPPNSSNTHA